MHNQKPSYRKKKIYEYKLLKRKYNREINDTYTSPLVISDPIIVENMPGTQKNQLANPEYK